MDNNSIRTDDFIAKTFRTYSDMIYRLAYTRTKSKYDSDDILQEVFIRFLKYGKEFNDDEHIKAWLLRVTINCTNSYSTSTWRKTTMSMEVLEDDTITIEPEEKGYVYYAVRDLPLKQRTVIHLFYYEEYSTAQIASLLDSKEGTVRSLLSRARDSLRKKLKGVEL